MGTRNITKVISNGKTVCCQYGQWDGYPTIVGVNVLEWVRKGDFDAIKGCTARVADDDEKVYYTGAPSNDYLDGLVKEHSRLLFNGNSPEDIDAIIREKYGYKAWILLKAASRDTGAEILNLVTEPVTLFSDAYDYSLEGTVGDIEAMNIIDLDNEKVTMLWHGDKREYSFEEISKLDIIEEMKAFEEGESA